MMKLLGSGDVVRVEKGDERGIPQEEGIPDYRFDFVIWGSDFYRTRGW